MVMSRVRILTLVAYRFNLPPHYLIHHIFHVSLLEVYHPFVLPEQQPARPPAIELESGNEYEVEEILDSFYVKNSIIGTLERIPDI